MQVHRGSLPPRSARRTRITAIATTRMRSAISAATRKGPVEAGCQRVLVSSRPQYSRRPRVRRRRHRRGRPQLGGRDDQQCHAKVAGISPGAGLTDRGICCCHDTDAAGRKAPPSSCTGSDFFLVGGDAARRRRTARGVAGNRCRGRIRSWTERVRSNNANGSRLPRVLRGRMAHLGGRHDRDVPHAATARPRNRAATWLELAHGTWRAKWPDPHASRGGRNRTGLDAERRLRARWPQAGYDHGTDQRRRCAGGVPASRRTAVPASRRIRVARRTERHRRIRRAPERRSILMRDRRGRDSEPRISAAMCAPLPARANHTGVAAARRQTRRMFVVSAPRCTARRAW